MSIPKPRIRPKAQPCRQRGEPPLQDPPVYGESDPPSFMERDPDGEPMPAEPVLFQEDDRLR